METFVPGEDDTPQAMAQALLAAAGENPGVVGARPAPGVPHGIVFDVPDEVAKAYRKALKPAPSTAKTKAEQGEK